MELQTDNTALRMTPSRSSNSQSSGRENCGQLLEKTPQTNRLSKKKKKRCSKVQAQYDQRPVHVNWTLIWTNVNAHTMPIPCDYSHRSEVYRLLPHQRPLLFVAVEQNRFPDKRGSFERHVRQLAPSHQSEYYAPLTKQFIRDFCDNTNETNDCIIFSHYQSYC